MGPALIHDYGIIGNGRSAALVGISGSIDWLCWPRFDSPSLFAALLDRTRGGHFLIAPTQPFTATRSYAPDSNVLVTTFTTDGGEARLTDLMPVMSEEEKAFALFPEHEILRVCTCVRGIVELRVEFHPRPDYARKVVPIRATRQLGFRIEDGRRLYTLRADRPLALVAPSDVEGRFLLSAGERATFSLSFDHAGPAVLPPLGAHAEDSVQRTIAWWQRWAARCNYDGPYREAVVRSVLVLKLLNYAPSGAIVAAPTTSLPERVGGDLNWDYRFCWVRDAALTVSSLSDLGYDDEATAFFDWLLHSTRVTRPALRVLYDVYGGVPAAEETLDHLQGHLGSRPVRIRNAAAGQLQLDGYGELVEAVTEMSQRGRTLARETQEMLRQLGDFVCDHWRDPDQGIWEPREPPSPHTYSRVMCWVALDRLLQLHRGGFVRRLPAARFEHERAAIRAEVERDGWSATLDSYAHVLGGDKVDASLLLLGRYGYAQPGDPRMRGSYRLIMERLRAGPGLLYRDETSAPAAEGAFGICSAWVTEHLAGGGGSLAEAEGWFRQFLGYGNDLGLFAEEIDPATGAALGNFPQAYSHVGLISAALAIEARRRQELWSGSEGRARHAPPPPGSPHELDELAGLGLRRHRRADDLDGGQRRARHHAHEHPAHARDDVHTQPGSRQGPRRRAALPERLGVLHRVHRRLPHRAHLHLVVRGAARAPPRRLRRRRRPARHAWCPPADGERAAWPDRRAPAGAARVPGAQLRRAHADLGPDRAPRFRRAAGRAVFARRRRPRPRRGAGRRRAAGFDPFTAE
jgi:GH15 family glucan-1,4-alpha-glucosidase